MGSEIKTLWTVMIYIAADNDLAAPAWNSVYQMMNVGRNPVFDEQVRLVIQFDPRDPKMPSRRVLRRGKSFANEYMEEMNTGDPRTLVDFIAWAHERNPAQNYLLILWGHANGTDDEDTDVDLKPLVANAPPPPAAPAVVAEKAASENVVDEGHFTESKRAPGSRKNFESSLEDIATGGAHPLDALTTFELKAALDFAVKEILKQKISILGMDACLMSMIEVCYQVSDCAGFYVGSEEAIPNTSWPYDRILTKLAARPSMQPSELAETIVEEYIAAYDEKKGAERKPVTLSLCDLSLSEELAGRVGEFSRLIGRKLSDPKMRADIVAARRKAQTFFIRDYVDLHHFCQLIKEKTADEQLKDACQQVMDGIKTRFVRKVGHTKPENPAAVDVLANANGLSVYFPLISHTYSSLNFSRRTHWDSFLDSYTHSIFQPTGVEAESSEAKTSREAVAAPPPVERAAVNTSSSQIVAAAAAAAGVVSHHPITGGTKVMNETTEDSTTTRAHADSPATDGTDGAAKPDDGVVRADTPRDAPVVPDTKKPHIVLPIGATITDPQNGGSEKLPDEAFLLFEEQNVVIEVPAGTSLTSAATADNKASKGTEMKATIGTRIVPEVGAEIRLPACTLWKAFTDDSRRDLAAGTVVKTEPDGAQIMILLEVAIKGF
jgi:hypothetical protein